MKPLSIAWVNVKRMLRETSNIFFVFVFPLALVLLIGIQFGGGFEPAVGINQADDGDLSAAVVAALQAEDSLSITVYDTSDALVTAVERGGVQAGILLPHGMDATAADGKAVDIGYLVRPDGSGVQLQSIVTATVGEVMGPVGAAQFAAAETGSGFDETLAAAQELSDEIQPIDVEVLATGEALFPATLGQFDLGASSELVLFVFLTALVGSSALILTRQLGISRRMLSTPTPIGSIILGESLGRYGTALLQGVYIMVLTLILFQVNWGDPVGAILILMALSAVGAGAGMLLGSTFNNDQQASGVAIVLALGLAALGGAMFPIELFSPTMQRVAHITPHAWALDGYAELVRHGGNTIDILPELAVLTLYAIVLMSLAAWRLRVAITRN